MEEQLRTMKAYEPNIHHAKTYARRIQEDDRGNEWMIMT